MLKRSLLKAKKSYLAPKGSILRVQRRKKRTKVGGISALIKALDRCFSLYTRLYYANDDGMVACYTCGHITHYKKIHAGHYISRYYKMTRWDENNVRPQCFMCNIYKKGDAVNFRERLIKEVGKDIIEKMEQESIKLLKMGTLEKEDLIRRIALYTEKANSLLPKS